MHPHCFTGAATTTGDTPLHRAVHYGHLDIAKLLLRAGADLEARDQKGRLPLSGSTADVWEALNPQVQLYPFSSP